MNDINLIVNPETRKYSNKKLKLIKIIAFFSLATIVVSSILVFILNAKFSEVSLKKQQADVVTQITAFNVRAAKLSAANSRAREIGIIQKQKKDYAPVINLILDNKPEAVNLGTMDVEPTAITINFTSSSLLSTSDFINKLLALSEKNTMISKLTIVSFSTDTTANTNEVSLKADLL